MSRVKTSFQTCNKEAALFLAPPNLEIDFSRQYIASLNSEAEAFLICNATGQTFALKTLQSTNALFLTKDMPNAIITKNTIQLFAACNKYIEVIKIQPDVLSIIKQVIQRYNQHKNSITNMIGRFPAVIDSYNSSDPITITCSIPEFVEFAANYLIVAGQECYYDNTIHSEVAILLARQFIGRETRYDDVGRLCLIQSTFVRQELQKAVNDLQIDLCAFPMLLFYADFHFPVYFNGDLHLERQQPDYSDLLMRLVYSGSLHVFEPIPIVSGEGTESGYNQFVNQYPHVDISSLVNKHLPIRLDCIKIVSEILIKYFTGNRIQTVSTVIEYLLKQSLPPEFYIELVWQLRVKFSEQIKQFKRDELIDISINNIQILPEFISLLCSAKTVGNYRPRIQTCYIDFSRKLGGTTQIIYLDELSLGKDIERAYQLSKIAKYWNQDQLRRLCGDSFTNYFRDDQQRADESSYESERVMLYTFKNELSFMV